MIGILILISLTIIFGPPLIFFSIGKSQKEIGKKERAKVFFILAVIYLIIGLGICGSLMSL